MNFSCTQFFLKYLSFVAFVFFNDYFHLKVIFSICNTLQHTETPGFKPFTMLHCIVVVFPQERS